MKTFQSLKQSVLPKAFKKATEFTYLGENNTTINFKSNPDLYETQSPSAGDYVITSNPEFSLGKILKVINSGNSALVLDAEATDTKQARQYDKNNLTFIQRQQG